MKAANMRYTKEMEDFLRENCCKYPDRRMAEEFNAEYGTNISWHQVRHFRRKHNISGKHHQNHSEIFTDEIRAFIAENYKGTGYKDMALLIYREFGVLYQPNQIRGYYRNHKLNSGLKGDLFQKGVANNKKQKKGQWYPGSEKGWFQKGEHPPNHVPVGTERVRPSNGYVWVKIGEPKKWRMKHLLVWEAAHGPVPKGWKIYFKDRNPQNCELDNLMLIEQATLSVMNRKGMQKYKGDLAEAAVNTVRLQLAVSKKKRKVEVKEE